ncbi:MAG: N-glycosylase [Thermoplasmatales archaeon]|jgi:N-glycosylase/DNA lyase|nr:N-glycosylase [Candidatus Thermoplasmatota archaeon]MCL6002628.1 N-glycosylase [Candidatus Thermoplasmatota archaeon]MDA8054440.1 N-glycosylase [Thermoplasmatales archaeon]
MLESLDGKIESVLTDKDAYVKILAKKEEFSEKRKASLNEKFSELMFCTLTANTSAEMGLRCQESLDRTRKFDQDNIRRTLLSCHYRFPNTRSRFISENYKKKYLLEDILAQDGRRDLLIENYIGIGMKEASHFLRNIGYFQYSILDKHIQRFLSSYFSREIKVKNRRDYEREEIHFLNISSKYQLEPGIMDLVIWYIMTGKILK